MSITKLLGSFPNSQIKPRSPVKESEIIEFALAAGIETQVLSENNDRIKAIIKNSGAGDIVYYYFTGAADQFTLNPGDAVTIEGGGDDVFVLSAAVGSVEIDDRIG